MAGEIKRLFFADGVTVTAAVDAATSKSITVDWNGTDTTKTVDVSSITAIAKSRIWQLKKPTADDGEQILCTITTPTDTSVYIDTDAIALASGTYTLVGA